MDEDDVRDVQAGICQGHREDHAFRCAEVDLEGVSAERDDLIDRSTGVIDTEEKIAACFQSAEGDIKRTFNRSREASRCDDEHTCTIDKTRAFAIHRDLGSDITERETSDSSSLVKGEVSAEACTREGSDGQGSIENFDPDVRSSRKSESLRTFGTEDELVSHHDGARVDLHRDLIGREGHSFDIQGEGSHAQSAGHSSGIDQEGSEATSDGNDGLAAGLEIEEGIFNIDAHRTVHILLKGKVTAKFLTRDIEFAARSRDLEVRSGRKGEGLGHSEDFIALIDHHASGVDAESEASSSGHFRNIHGERSAKLCGETFRKDEEVAAAFRKGDEVLRGRAKGDIHVAQAEAENVDIVSAVSWGVIAIRAEAVHRKISNE